MPFWEPLVTAGLHHIFGEESSEDARHAAEQQALANYNRQKEFAQFGIRWRVEDAKAAGVHPLFALGAGGSAFAPNPIVLGDERPRAAVAENFSKGMSQLLVELFKSNQQKDLVQSQAMTSMAALAQTVAASATPYPALAAGNFTPGEEMEWPGYPRSAAVPMSLQNAVDAQQLKPDERLSSRSSNPGISAATGRPESMEVTTPGGLRMLLPQASTAAEAHESLGESPLEFLRYMQMNSDYYGPGWLRAYLKQYPGAKQLIQIGEELGQVASDFSRHARGPGSQTARGRIRSSSYRDRPYYGPIPEVGY